jgi:hypothetical protein
MKLNCRQERNDIDRQHFACLFEVGSCADFKFREKYLFAFLDGEWGEISTTMMLTILERTPERKHPTCNQLVIQWPLFNPDGQNRA